jgi:hypothetical protein
MSLDGYLDRLGVGLTAHQRRGDCAPMNDSFAFALLFFVFASLLVGAAYLLGLL